jgi:molybdenum cofactor cytidylyltransferase
VIPAVVLAAGKSTRMGRSKAMLALGPGETFLTRIVRTFQQAQIDDVVIVLGHDPEHTRESVLARGLSPRFVQNPRYESGQLSSLLAGLNAIDRPGVTAMLLTLVDVPLVSPATVRAVVAHYDATRAPIVRPVHGALHGHPVLVDRSLFGLMRAADPGAGAKPIVRAHASAAGDITVDDEGAFLDIDTPDEYARVLERLDAGQLGRK